MVLHKKLLRPVVAIAVVAAALGWLAFTRGAEQSVQPKPVPDQSALPITNPSAVAIPASASTIAPSLAVLRKVPEVDEMRGRFQKTDNFAAFIQDALTKPEAGGRFYAHLAFVHCKRINAVDLATLPSSTPISEQRALAIAEITKVKGQCAPVAQVFPDDFTFHRQLISTGVERDPLMLKNGVTTAPSKNTAHDDLRRAVQVADPYVLATVLESNVDFLAERLGREFEPSKAHVLHMAAGSMACEFIGDCGSSTRAALYCAIGGHCGVDERRLAREQLDPEERELFDLARVRLQQLVANP